MQYLLFNLNSQNQKFNKNKSTSNWIKKESIQR